MTVGRLVAVWLGAFVFPALAAEDACRDLPAAEPMVEVVVEPGEPRYDATRSGAEIAELSTGGGSMPGGEPLGLTRVEERVETRLAFQEVERGEGWCVAPTEIEVTVRYGDMTVFVDRRFEEGTCQHRVVLEHENEHVRINRAALAEAAGAIRDAVRRGAEGRGWRHGEPEGVRQSFLQELRAVLDGPLAEMRERRTARHAEIDTLAAYRALTARCSDW